SQPRIQRRTHLNLRALLGMKLEPMWADQCRDLLFRRRRAVFIAFDLVYLQLQRFSNIAGTNETQSRRLLTDWAQAKRDELEKSRYCWISEHLDEPRIFTVNSRFGNSLVRAFRLRSFPNNARFANDLAKKRSDSRIIGA